MWWVGINLLMLAASVKSIIDSFFWGEIASAWKLIFNRPHTIVMWIMGLAVANHQQWRVFFTCSVIQHSGSGTGKSIIHSVLLTWKSRGGLSAIGWQAAAPTYQQMPDSQPRCFLVRKTLWINGHDVDHCVQCTRRLIFPEKWDLRVRLNISTQLYPMCVRLLFGYLCEWFV